MFIAYSHRVFGTWLPSYFAASRLDLRGLPGGLLGLTLSPSRGLFVYVPVAAFIVFAAVRFWNNLASRQLALLSLAIVAGLLVVASSNPVWWGGQCYGARMMTDAVPWLFLLAVIAMPCVISRSSRMLWVGAMCLLLSIIINARGAISWDTEQWNERHNFYGQALFDWRHPQFLAGLTYR